MAKPSILIVDDTEDNRLGLADWLEERYECLMAESADQAEVILRDARPLVILLDLSLPGRSGWEFAYQLKADGRTRDIPIIAISAFVAAVDRERALEAGCDGFLPKPFRMAQLFEAIERVSPQAP
ncbi:MAG: response regulator [Candidatus Lambdaproteobacteria bacterium]|nr:response regulator [Candidatus Lambdaproteobacteria bacterium]